MSYTYRNSSEIVRALKPSNSKYCFHPSSIKRQVDLFLDIFPGSVSWAVKSNPEPAVIKAIYEAGLRNFDVASLNEVELISKFCPNSRLCFNHPVKSFEAIRDSYFKYGVKVFVVDHKDEIDKIFSALDGQTDILLQIRFFDSRMKLDSNVNFGKKFGASPEDASALLQYAYEKGFCKLGLAFHPSTQYPNPYVYEHLLNIACEIVQSTQTNNIQLQMINIGGGFPVRYPDENIIDDKQYLRIVAKSIQVAKEKFGAQCEFMCEPGRALVARCASLITRVELNRHDGRLYLNDGFFGALMEQHFVGFSLPVRVHTHDGRSLAVKQQNYTIFGPTCDCVDVLSKQYQLPCDIEIGDYLEFGLMGAYTNASATSFNGFEPAEILFVEQLDFT